MSHSPILTFLVLLLLPLIHGCVPFLETVRSEQRRYIAYQQRGLPRRLLKPFFVAFLDNLVNYSSKAYLSTELRDVCFTPHDMETLHVLYNFNAIDEEIATLQTYFPQFPYLAATEVANLEFDSRAQRAHTHCYNKTSHAITEGKTPQQAVFLPPTSRVLYDPFRKQVVHAYKKTVSHAPTCSACDLLSYVTGLVIRLELLGVSRCDSIKLLRHAVASISNTYRALRKDGPTVRVPALFLPFYQDRFRVLSDDDESVPEVPASVVKKVLGDSLQLYMSQDSWGRLEVIRHRGDELYVWTIEKELFDPDVLAVISSQIQYKDFVRNDHPPFDEADIDDWLEAIPEESPHVSYDPKPEASPDFKYSTKWVERKLQRSKDKDYIALSTSARGGQVVNAGVCMTPVYEYVPTVVGSWEEACCAAICCNVQMLLEVYLQPEDCCMDCNQSYCAIENTPLEDLAEIVLEPYGWDLGAMVVLL